jgi:hypothetical protein
MKSPDELDIVGRRQGILKILAPRTELERGIMIELNILPLSEFVAAPRAAPVLPHGDVELRRHRNGRAITLRWLRHYKDSL